MYRKSIASFMIVLIITLPIYAAFVFGDLRKVWVEGDDGVDSYVRKNNDHMNVNAYAKIDDDEITKEQVRLKFPTSPSPDEFMDFTEGCTKITDNPMYVGHYDCKSVLSTTNLPDKGINEFYVYLFDGEDEKVGKSGKLTVKIDDVAPLIEVTKQPEFNKNDETYSVSVLVTDKDNEGKGKCSRISKVEFYAGSALLETKEFDGSSCIETVSVKLSVGGGGDTKFTIKAYDRLGNENSTETELFYVDNEKPKISSSFKITHKDSGKEIEYFSVNKEFEGDVVVEIRERNLSYVKADLSSLNPVYSSIYKSMEWGSSSKVRCEETEEETWECRFYILFILDSETNEIIVTARDYAGNEDTVTSSVTISKDDVSPEIIDIITGNCNSDRSECYVKEGNNEIILEIDEIGSGFENDYNFGNAVGKSLFLNLESLNDDYEGKCMVIPICEESGGRWVCSITVEVDEKTQGEKLDVNIRKMCSGYYSADDAKNEVIGVLKKEFVYDNEAPILVEDIVISGDKTDYWASGDLLTLRIKAVEEVSELKSAKADFSDFSTAGVLEGSCSKVDEEWVCEWADAGSIITGHGENHSIFINLTDAAGNINETVIKRPIYFVEDVEPDYWKIKSISEPDPIDRQILSYYPWDVWVPVELESSSSLSVEPLRLDLFRCDEGDIELVDDPSLIRVGYSNRFYLKFPLDISDVEEKEVIVNCSLGIISRINKERISKEEIENITLSLRFYNAPLGSLDVAVQNEIDDIKNSFLVRGEWIASLNKFFDFINKMCNIVNMIGTVIQAIELIFQAVSWTQNTGIGTAVAESARVMSGGANVGVKPVYKIIGWVCAVGSCNLWDKIAEETNTDWVGYIDFVYDLYEKVYDLLPETIREELKLSADPRDSLILSILAVCIPGIMYNLQKARNIECEYIYCLENYVPAGEPIYGCVARRSFDWCKFVYGEIWELIAFNDLWESLIEWIEDALANPVTFALTIVGIACTVIPKAEASAGCMVIKSISLMMGVVDQIIGMTENKDYWTFGGPDRCEDVLD